MSLTLFAVTWFNISNISGIETYQKPSTGNSQKTSRLDTVNDGRSGSVTVEIDQLRQSQLALTKQVAELTNQIARLTKESSLELNTHVDPQVTNGGNNSQQLAQQNTLSSSRDRETVLAKRAQVLQQLYNDFYQKEVDLGWSRVATEHLNTMIGQYNEKEWKGISFDNVECCSSFCKIEVGADDELSMIQFN